jgi:hypothetical protein
VRTCKNSSCEGDVRMSVNHSAEARAYSTALLVALRCTEWCLRGVQVDEEGRIARAHRLVQD